MVIHLCSFTMEVCGDWMTNATIRDAGQLPKMALRCFCYSGNLHHIKDRSLKCTSMARAKGADQVIPRLKPKEERVSWSEKKKAPGRGSLWESVHLQHTLETTQNKQVKIKPQSESQSVCLTFLQTEDYRVTISKVWEIVSFVVYPTTIQPIIYVAAPPLADAQRDRALWRKIELKRK